MLFLCQTRSIAEKTFRFNRSKSSTVHRGFCFFHRGVSALKKLSSFRSERRSARDWSSGKCRNRRRPRRRSPFFGFRSLTTLQTPKAKHAPRQSFATTGRTSLSSFHLRQIKMSATMASANLRATGAAPRVVARSSASSRVATMFRTAGPDVERKLGDAMVAAAGKFGAKHQMEVRAALNEDAPAPERRAFLKKALLGVRARADPRAITRAPPRHLWKKQPTRGGILPIHTCGARVSVLPRDRG
jgi:hypothetical protein